MPVLCSQRILLFRLRFVAKSSSIAARQPGRGHGIESADGFVPAVSRICLCFFCVVRVDGPVAAGDFYQTVLDLDAVGNYRCVWNFKEYPALSLFLAGTMKGQKADPLKRFGNLKGTNGKWQNVRIVLSPLHFATVLAYRQDMQATNATTIMPAFTT